MYVRRIKVDKAFMELVGFNPVLEDLSTVQYRLFKL
jgi:hypothetical protein